MGTPPVNVLPLPVIIPDGKRFFLLPRAEKPGGVSDGQQGRPHIGKEGTPDGDGTQVAAVRTSAFTPRARAIFCSTMRRKNGDAHRRSNLKKLIIHNHHVGGLDSRIGAGAAHGDADVGPGKSRSIINPVSHKGQPAP